MVNSVEFTKRLQEILKFYGLSATAFAETIDFNRSTISHLLSGRNKPSLEFVMKVVTKFPEVELHWLLNGKGSFPPVENFTSNLFEQSLTKSNQISKIAENELKDEVPAPYAINSVKSSNNFEVEKKSNTQSIDRIIIFFNDGSFKEYLP